MPAHSGLWGGLSKKEMAFAAKGLDLSRPHASTRGVYLNPNLANYNNITPDQINRWNQGVTNIRDLENKNALRRWKWENRIYQGRLASIQLGKMGAGFGLGVLGMDQMTREDGNGWNMASGVLYSIAGTAAMTGNYLVAGVAGAVGAIAQFTAEVQKMNDTVRAFKDDSELHKVENGITSNSDDPNEQLLDLIYNKHKNINDLVEKRIKLTRKLLDTASGEKEETKGDAEYKKRLENRIGGDGFWSSLWHNALNIAGRDWNGVLKSFNGSRSRFDDYEYENAQMAKYSTLGQFAIAPGESKFAGETVWEHRIGNTLYRDLIKNKQDPNNAYTTAAIGTYMTEYAQKGVAAGQEVKKGIAKRILAGSSLADIQAYIDEQDRYLNPKYVPNLIRPNQYNHGRDYFLNASEDTKNSWSLTRQAEYDSYQATIRETLEAYRQFAAQSAYGDISAATILQYLRSGVFANNGHAEYASLLGLYNPTDLSLFEKTIGLSNGQFVEMGGKMANENAINAYNAFTNIKSHIEQANLSTQPALQPFIAFIDAIIRLAEAQTTNGDLAAASANYLAQSQNVASEGMLNTANSMLGLGAAATYTSGTAWAAGLNVYNMGASVGAGLGNFGTGIFNVGNILSSVDWGSKWSALFPPMFGVNVGAPSIAPPPAMGGYGFGGGGSLWSGSSMFGGGSNRGFGGKIAGFINGGVGGGYSGGINTNYQFTYNGGKKTNNYDPYADNNYSINSNTGGSKSGKKTTKPSKPTVPSQKDYKSNYNNDSAAPKQVIVNISNLMNVDKVDLSKEDNKVAIANLKDQLSEALIDVVREFDSTWHG